MNYVRAAQLANLKKDWEKNEAILYSYTAIALYLNDQVYNFQISLDEAITKSDFNRHSIKKYNNQIKKNIKAYNAQMERIMKEPIYMERFANMLSEIEEECASSLELYKFQVSQFLLDHGICGDKNMICSLASTINMLCQTSRCTIEQHYVKFSVLNADIRTFKMDDIERLSDLIANDSMLKIKDLKIDLNDGTGILRAFNAFTNKLLSGKVQETIFK